MAGKSGGMPATAPGGRHRDPVVAAAVLALWLLLARTRFGMLIRAASENREIAGALGINERLLFTAVFALGAGLAGLAGARPVLEIYEDLHWVDPSTLELLDLLVERVRGLPVLAVLTYRPEFTPPWSGQAHVTALPLNRLGRRQGAVIVERIAGGKITNSPHAMPGGKKG